MKKSAAIYIGVFGAILAVEGLAIAAGGDAATASSNATNMSLLQAAAAVEMAEVNFMGIGTDDATP